MLYQPIVELSTQRPIGVEALLRWAHPKHGKIPPAAFIPMLEETGLIIDLGRWVLREACMQAARLRSAGHDITMSVNTSIRQLERHDFVRDAQEAIESSGIPASSLVIEITETAIMHNADAAVAALQELKHFGIRIAIDDFGTGYSSLAYLSRFPLDALKIDRIFIEGGPNSVPAQELIHTLVKLGKSLQLETLAEGIETHAQLRQLQEEGCDRGQGYLFAAPLAAESLIRYLDQRAGRTGDRDCQYSSRIRPTSPS